jgi:hypothetical protein
MFRGIPLLSTWLGPNNKIRQIQDMGAPTAELRLCGGPADIESFVTAFKLIKKK